MSDTSFSRYHVTAPDTTLDALRDEFHPDTDNYKNGMQGDSLVILAPARDDPGMLADTLPASPVEEFLDDNGLDYETISSKPVRKPSELPEELRDELSVRDVVGDIELASYIEDAIGDDDPREHSLQGRIRFAIGTDHRGDPQPDPLTVETIRDLQDDGLIQDDSGPYPSGQQLLDWHNDLQVEFGDDVEMRGIGAFMAPMSGYPEGVVMLDGVGVTTTDDSTLPDEVIDWVRARFDHSYDETQDQYTIAKPDYLDMTYPAEFQLRQDNDWVRMWWD